MTDLRVQAALPGDFRSMRLFSDHAARLADQVEFRMLGLRPLCAVPFPSSGPTRSGNNLRQLVRSAYHFHGTCPLGIDPATAVVAPDLRVFGTENLYVADAGVLPVQFGANPHHVTRAVALRAAELLLTQVGQVC
jgi:choline dehydrogenase